MNTVILKKNKGLMAACGHPWIYNGEIDSIKGNPADGDICDVMDNRHRFLGRGYINQKSSITIRLLTPRKEPIDADFFEKRIKSSIKLRNGISSSQAKRLVCSEADFLPGLIVDLYNDILVIQTLTLGMDKWKETIINILQKLINPKAIFERDEAPSRLREGLDLTKGFLRGSGNADIKCDICGITFMVDVVNGQKTGMFLDQKDNYLSLKTISEGKKTLDCFCYTGGFGISSAKSGAKSVLGIDISDTAVKLAAINSKLNNVSHICDWKAVNVFDFLRDASDKRDNYDIIILDPPSFTKNKDSIPQASRGYKEINLRALKILNPGGFLITCCCSHHIKRDLFLDVIKEAAKDAHKILRQTDYLTQSKDHPIIPSIPETEYLKCFIFEIVQ